MAINNEDADISDLLSSLQCYIELQKQQIKSDWLLFQEKNLSEKSNNEDSDGCLHTLSEEVSPLSNKNEVSTNSRELEKQKLIDIFSKNVDTPFGLYEKKREIFIKQLKQDYRDYLKTKKAESECRESMVGIGKYSPNNFRLTEPNSIAGQFGFQARSGHSNLTRINEDEQFLNDLSQLSNHLHRLGADQIGVLSPNTFSTQPTQDIRRLQAQEYRRSLEQQIEEKKMRQGVPNNFSEFQESVLPGAAGPNGSLRQRFPSKPAFLENREAYLMELKDQMDLKKKKLEQDRLLEEMEEKRVNARVEEQRERMKREYEEEMNKKKLKEDERQQRVLYIQQQQQEQKQQAEQMKRENRMKKLQRFSSEKVSVQNPTSPPSPPLPITRLEKEIKSPIKECDVATQITAAEQPCISAPHVLSQLTSIRQRLKQEQLRLSKKLGLQESQDADVDKIVQSQTDLMSNSSEALKQIKQFLTILTNIDITEEKYVPTWHEGGGSTPRRSQSNSAVNRQQKDPSFSTLSETHLALKALIEKNKGKVMNSKGGAVQDDRNVTSPELERLQEKNRHRQEDCVRSKGLLDNTKLLAQDLQERHRKRH